MNRKELLLVRSALRNSITLLTAGIDALSKIDQQRTRQLALEIRRTRKLLESIGGIRHHQDTLDLAPYVDEVAP